MSSQIKCGKCGILFEKELCPRRKNDYYRTCQSCRDKMNSKAQPKRKKSKPKPEPELVDDEFEPGHENDVDDSDSHKSETFESELSKSEQADANSEQSKESEHDANSINEEFIFRTGSTGDKPINIDDLQAEIESKITQPILFDVGDSNKKELTVSEKLTKIMELIETSTSQLRNQADGYNASTKCMLDRIKSNVIQARMGIGSSDTNYNTYEMKVDKLTSRINELETNLKLFVSTTLASASDLKRCVSESEDNLKNVLQQIYNKI